MRAFVLEREGGNLLIYAAPTVGDGVDAPLLVHADDRDGEWVVAMLEGDRLRRGEDH